jgi:hypothetical protein
MEAGGEFGIAPVGVEAQRVLRLEKAHIIVGQDTDALSDPFSANMEWAVKLDKRDFLAGYDVYAAFSQDGGRSFGRNIKVQDSFGDNVSQWHAAIAANPTGRIVAVWDDDRDGTPDIWLSNWDGKTFSDNIAVPGAFGPGVQTDPVMDLDATDTLHMAWLERNEDGGTRLKYTRAIWKK